MKALYRGFCRNENGKETIYLNEEVVKGDWVYGNLFQTEKWANILTVTNSANEKSVEYEQYKVIPETVCEAVRGFTDKNGRQVFSEDLFRDERGIEFIIYYDEDELSWMCVSLKGNCIPLYYVQDHDIEVIGTKWDRKEE